MNEKHNGLLFQTNRSLLNEPSHIIQLCLNLFGFLLQLLLLINLRLLYIRQNLKFRLYLGDLVQFLLHRLHLHSTPLALPTRFFKASPELSCGVFGLTEAKMSSSTFTPGAGCVYVGVPRGLSPTRDVAPSETPFCPTDEALFASPGKPAG